MGVGPLNSPRPLPKPAPQSGVRPLVGAAPQPAPKATYTEAKYKAIRDEVKVGNKPGYLDGDFEDNGTHIGLSLRELSKPRSEGGVEIGKSFKPQYDAVSIYQKNKDGSLKLVVALSKSELEALTKSGNGLIEPSPKHMRKILKAGFPGSLYVVANIKVANQTHQLRANLTKNTDI